MCQASICACSASRWAIAKGLTGAAPRLLTAADVALMKPGSVVVDMAAGQGGNVEGSVAGERVVTDGGVVILGYTDLAGRLPQQASQLYGTNLVNLLALLTPASDGTLVYDENDVVQRAVTVTREGAVTWPPPPVQVSAAPAPAASAAAAATGSASGALRFDTPSASSPTMPCCVASARCASRSGAGSRHSASRRVASRPGRRRLNTSSAPRIVCATSPRA